ncbi:MAG: hypothetical protein EZS28_009472, partial [Streblomastix strix]
MNNCKGTVGGGIYSYLTDKGKVTINGTCIISNCQSTSGNGGGIYSYIYNTNSKYVISGQIEIKDCSSSSQGGGLWTEAHYGQQVLEGVNISGCSSQIGGAIYAQILLKVIFTINGSSSISNCNSTSGSGGGIYLYMSESDCLSNIYGLTEIKNCSSSSQGGGIFAELHNGDFVLTGVSIIDCQSTEGGGIYQILKSYGILTINGSSLIENCNSTSGSGGGIYIYNQDTQSKCIISGSLTIKDCNSQTIGGGIQTELRNGEFTFSGIIFDNCQSNSGGGGLNSSLTSGGRLNIKDSSMFTNCRSISGPGGALYSYISNGKLSFDTVQFSYCSCSQPNNGGALYITQQSTSSNISITKSSFKNCQTNSSSSQKYGWGGAIFIYINYSAGSLSQNRFSLNQLVFDENQVAGMGLNIHIQSDDTLATGTKIYQESILSVNDTTNLYSSPSYAYEYIGINNTVNNNSIGTIEYSKHNPLFEKNFASSVPNPSYIDASNGNDNLKYCGGFRFKCQTISYSIGRDPKPLSGISPAKIIKLILTSDPSLDNNLQINIPTTYWDFVTIQSDGYLQDSLISTNPKYQILTSSQSNSLFTITGAGHLDLLGLHFTNLNPTSQEPLISIQSVNNAQVPILSIIDCELNQDSTQYSSASLMHGLIFINGGKLTISKTIIKDYKLKNGKSSLMIYSDISSTSGVYRINQIDIINSIFENIKQVEGSGSGSAINVEFKAASILKITDTTLFTNCESATSGGAIQSEIQGGTIELSEVTMNGCKGSNGGGIYSIISSGGTLTIKESCSFMNCISQYGNGGGIYIDIEFSSQSIISIEDCIFSHCSAIDSTPQSSN